MARFMGEVILFTANTVTLISGSTPDFSLPEKYVYKELSGAFGCDAHRSISQGNNSIYWANKVGVYRYTYLPSGFSIPECVSEFNVSNGTSTHSRSIAKAIRAISDWTKVFAQFYDNEYRLYVGSNQVWVFDTIASTWAFYEYNIPFNCCTLIDKKLMYGAAYIYEMDKEFDVDGATFDGLNDDGVAIAFRLESKFHNFEKAANKKRFKKLYISLFSELVSYDIDLEINLDNDLISVTDEIVNNISRWGAFKFGDKVVSRRTNLNYPIRVHHKSKKYNLQYALISKGLNMAWKLKGIELLAKIKELK
jgi:hypothetical protein